MNNDDFLSLEEHSEPAGQGADETILEETNPGSGQPRFSVFAGLQSVFIVAFLIASLFTLFTPNNLFSGETLERIFQAWQANPTTVAPLLVNNSTPETARIGIVAGHWQNDSGAVCDDGLTEEQVNLQIATLVQQKLIAEGYAVDLLSEFDERLSQYKAMVLISIHADTCEYISNEATGFKVSAAIHSFYPEKANRLVVCMADRYQAITGLKYRPNSTTPDMTSYHAFDEIHTETTAAIIETGFLNLDRQILTENPDLIAQGIVNGLICYIRNENVTLPTPLP
jgi:N-acetylmuramoyl-L-alanine amidase